MCDQFRTVRMEFSADKEVKLRKLFALLLAVCVFGGCSGQKIKFDHQSFKLVGVESSDHVKERLSQADSWVKAACSVAGRSRLQEAMDLCALISLDARVSIPKHPEGQGWEFAVLREAKRHHKIDIVPLLRSDADIDPQFGTVIEEYGQEAGSYVPKLNSIMLYAPSRYSWDWRGAIMLHEARHAVQDLEGGASEEISTDPPAELDAHQFGGKVLARVAPGYGKIVEAEVARIAKAADHCQHMPGNSVYDDRLDRVFGKPASEAERQARETQLWFEGAFGAIDRDCGDKAFDYKMQFLEAVYSTPPEDQ